METVNNSSVVGPSLCFQIQKVIGFSAGNGALPTYQVQWAPAWVSGHHLVGCEHLIEDFLQKQATTSNHTETEVKNTEFYEECHSQKSCSENSNGYNTRDPTKPDLTSSSALHDEPCEVADEDEETGELWQDHVPVDDGEIYYEEGDEYTIANDGDTTVQQSSHFDQTSNITQHEMNSCENTTSSTHSDSQLVTVVKEEYEVTEYHHQEEGGYSNMSMVNSNDEYTNNAYYYTHDTNEHEHEPEHEIKKKRRRGDTPNNVPWESLVETIGGQYKCLACGRMFNDKSNLRQHIRTHSNERPYTCEVCHKSFKWNKVLKRHMATHFTVKPYQCSLCEKAYTQRQSLKSHLKHSHGQDIDVLT